MGVRGLWGILKPAGFQVNETELHGKRLAVDISIWIYQLLRVIPPHARNRRSKVLSCLFKRLCKLIFIGVLPIVVFDGAAPLIKRRVIRERQKERVNAEERQRKKTRRIIAMQLILRQQANSIDPSGLEASSNALEKINDINHYDEIDSSDDEIDYEYLYSVDPESNEFKSLPSIMRQEILLAKREAITFNYSLKNSQVDLQNEVFDAHDFKNNEQARLFSNRQVESLVKKRKIGAHLERLKDGEEDLDISNIELIYSHSTSKLPSKRISSTSNRSYSLIKKNNGSWSLGVDANMTVSDPKSQPLPNLENLPVKDDFSSIFGDDLDENIDSNFENISRNASKGINHNSENSIQRMKPDLHAPSHTSFDSPSVPDRNVLNDRPTSGCLFENKRDHLFSLTEPDISGITSKNELVCNVDYEIEKFLPESTHKDVTANISMALDLDIDGKIDIPNLVSKKDVPAVKYSDDDSLTGTPSEDDNYTVDTFLESSTVAKSNDYYDKIDQSSKGLPIFENDVLSSIQKDIKDGLQEITSHETIDTELLEDFRRMLIVMGIPWVISPGEAEAQCVWLEKNNHVDGVISDDNDTAVFGSHMMIRNFFGSHFSNISGSQPTVYTSERIKNILGLDQEGLISLSALLGSDYSVGVKGIGPKKAIGLVNIISQSLKDTTDSLQTIIKGLSTGNWPLEVDTNQIEHILKPKPLLLGSFFTDDPMMASQQIRNAYLNPNIDDSKVQFSWKSMLKDIPAIVAFIKSDRMRWTDLECRFALDPLIRRGF